MIRKNQVRFGGGRMEKVRRCTLSGLHRWNLVSRLPYIIWGFRHVAGFRRRHVGASIHAAWTDSLESVRAGLDASTEDDRTLLLRADHPGARADARRRARCGHDASGSLAEAGRRRVWACGAVRDESAISLGLRARTDTSQPTDALARSAIHPRPRRQPTADHGPLTGSSAVRVQPHGAHAETCGCGLSPTRSTGD
jgi:hypothetical protein